uniref:Hypothetical copper homeostasis c-terminal truncated transmembrane protein n=1 Tax=Spiroplasma citri TaxID=2133 RepID=Q14LT8_SPICI|nr:hypothetical copper homeostasis c-terminal truncated transmembrane protein [Spiroplasma citri]
MFIEVIARNYQECQSIEQAGNIDQIELCTNLSQRGLTPPYAVIRECIEQIKVSHSGNGSSSWHWFLLSCWWIFPT